MSIINAWNEWLIPYQINFSGGTKMNVTIFGKGNMAAAIAKNFEAAGNTVNYVGHETDATLNEVVVLAVPYPAVDDVIDRYKEQLNGKIVVDITNPLNFETWDELVVPADGSAASEIQKKLPNSKVVKGFNTNFAGTLDSAKVGGEIPTVVLLASDFADAKEQLITALKDSPLTVVDAGSLKRARELEAFGFLQMTLAVKEAITWAGGFGIVK
jgi:hypothetical protein